MQDIDRVLKRLPAGRERLSWDLLDCPIPGIGLVTVLASEKGLFRVWPRTGTSTFDQTLARLEAAIRRSPRALTLERGGLPADFVRELGAYFAGELREFATPLDLDEQGTSFQREVWRALATIPYGSTWSYGELARQVKRPRAARAVGQANGRNPLPIVIPCHRVISHDDSLGGYTGGLSIKKALLAVEASEHAARCAPAGC